MNAKQFWKLNPNFKFNRIFLFNQSKFNNYGNMTKFLFPLDKGNYNNYINELKEGKNLDYLTQNLISKYKKQILCSPSNKKNNIKIIRSTILKNNSRIKQIDFNKDNISDEFNNSFELDINPYFSCKKHKNKNRILSKIKENKRTIYYTEGNTSIKNTITKNDNSLIGGKSEMDKLKLPCITTNNNKKDLFSPINKSKKDINNNNKIRNENSEKKNKGSNTEDKKNNNNKEIQKDIFNNINYCLDNKKSQLNVKDIQRNINISKNAKEEDQDYENLESSIFINTKIENPNEKHTLNKNEIMKINTDDLIDNEEIKKRKEKDKYIIYDQNKKFIEKNKIYDAMKYGAASIPNLTLDKSFRDIKKFESNVLNLKKTHLELPLLIKTNQIN